MFSDPGWLNDFFRTIFTALDNFGYFFLNGIFSVFFTIVNAELFSGELISTFYERVQLILGVLMIFKLSITLLQIIVNPDMFKDKQKGAGSLVKRVAIVLVLLSLIVPIEGIPEDDSNPLNQQIRANGILFGFLYQFQDSVIQDNILGKLILGSNTDTISEESGSDLNNMSDIGSVMSSTVAKAFIRPTIKEGASQDFASKQEYEDNVACPGETEAMPWFNSQLTSGTLINHINDTCESEETGEEVYVFDYTILGGLICSIIMTIIIIGFTLDIAVRAIKLAVLRLIAPVPIISYISPGQEKDGAFGNWVKTLTSTYLSLFIRLAIIYFGAYLIIVVSAGEFNIWQSSPSFITSLLASIFIIIGILVFMKQAPKFFQDMFGLKGDGKLFSGIGTMLGAAALGAGLVGAARGSYRIGMDEARELGLSDAEARSRARRAAVGGVFGGGYAGMKAFMTSDKKVPSSVFAAMQKRQAIRGSGVTLGRKISSTASGLLAGSSLGGRSAAQAELYQKLTKAAQAHKSMVEDEALKDTTIEGNLSYLDHMGHQQTLSANYQDFYAQYEAAKAAGKNTFSFTDSAGMSHVVSTKSINVNNLDEFKQSQATNYLNAQRALAPAARNAKVAGTARELEYAANKVSMDIDAYKYGGTPADTVKGIKGTIGASINAARDINANPELQWDIAADKQVNNSGK